MKSEIEVLGQGVKLTEEMVCLTDLWKASGQGREMAPYEWARIESSEQFIETVAQKQNTGRDRVLKSKRGKGGGTWAHWQIAMAYAKYLSPELHMQVNELVKRFMDADPSVAESIIDRTENPEDLRRIEARARNVASNKELNGTIAEHGGVGKIYARVADINNICVTGKPAKELRAEHGLPAKASTRPHLSTQDMTRMAYLEQLEKGAIRKRKSFGNEAITGTIADAANRMAQLEAELT